MRGSELGAQINPEPKRLYDVNLDKAAIGSANVAVARLRPIRCVALAPLAARPRGRDLQLADAVQYRRAAPSATAHC